MTFRRFAGTKIALAIAFTLAVVVSRPGGRAEPPTDPKEIKVTVKDNELFLQGAKLVFPGDMEQIVKVLGKPSRVVDDAFQRSGSGGMITLERAEIVRYTHGK